ncbi:MAG: HD domain-containing phosphohydrolase [Spirochaetota bacterium]
MKNLSILAIEDSEDDAFMAKAILQKNGYSVDHARVENAQALKTALETSHWDLILSDYNLPQFNGLMALVVVRKYDPEIPFILVSGAIGEETAVAMMKAGATDYVRKDQLQRLPAAVERSLKEAEVRRDNRESHAMLVRSQEQLENALVMARLGHWEYDVLADQFTFNDHCYQIFKTTAEAAGGYRMDSKTYARLFVHPGDYKKVKDESIKAINALDPRFSSQFEHRTAFPDGNVGILSVRFSVVKDDKGRTVKVYGVVQDITELKSAEQVLKDRDALLRKLSANVPGMIYQCFRKADGTYNFPFTTSAIRELFGCAEEDVTQDWTPLVSVILPEDRPAFLEGFERSARTMGVRHSEYRVQIAGQPVKWILGRSTPEKLPDGSIVWHGFAMDITERKRVEEEVHKNESRLEGLLQLSHFKTDSMREFLDFALEEAIRLTGSVYGYIYYYDDATQSFSLGTWSRSVMESCAQHSTTTFTTLAKAGFWAEAVRQGNAIVDNDFSSPKNLKRGYPSTHAPILKFLSVPVFRDGRIVAVAGVANKAGDYDASDVRQLTLLMETVWRITEENRIAKALQTSESKYRGIFDNAQEGIFQSTPDGLYVAANAAMAKILGYDSPEDLISSVRDISSQIYIYPEDRQRLLSLIEQNGTVHSFESLYRRKDGSPVWVSVSLHPVVDEKGVVQHFQGFLEDITERRKGIERLKEALKATVLAISASVEAKDPYTAGHQSRVADLGLAIAGELGLSEDDREGLRLAATIHDLGKLSVPTEILTKPKKLLDVEFEIIKTHSRSGYEILSKIDFPWPIARMVLEHHERMDGSGYPQGLKGSEVLLQSRILAVADVVESMASHRPYRPALGIIAALAEIEANADRLYDSEVVRACLSLFRNRGYELPVL